MFGPVWMRWGLALPLLTLNLFVLRQLLVPLAPFPGLFLTAALIAFLLSIPSRWLRARGLPDWLAISLVFLVAVGILVISGITLVPLLIDQLAQLINALPGWLEASQGLIARLQEWATARGLPSEFADLSSDVLTRASRLASQFSQQLLSILGATLGTTINTVIVLVLAVFFLLGGESITAGLVRWLPQEWRQLVVTTITRTFRGYFAGQVVLALILSAGQIAVFTLLKIPLWGVVCCLDWLNHLDPLCQCFHHRCGECFAGGARSGNGRRHPGGSDWRWSDRGSSDPATLNGEHRWLAAGLAAYCAPPWCASGRSLRFWRTSRTATSCASGELHQNPDRCLG